MGGRLGACLTRPVTDKVNEAGAGNGLRYAVSSMQGWRTDMEDAHSALAEIAGPGPPDPDARKACSFFGVFDGHAGGGAAHHCAAHLFESVRETDEWREGRPGDALRTGFLLHDERLRGAGAAASAGCTAVVALVEPDRLWLANCGDSRAVVCRGGAPALVTRDHKPASPEEALRIRRAGGAVLLSRVNGSLAVSRALGDFAYKQDPELAQCEQLVSPEPDIFRWERDLSADQFLLLACDGLWDVISNEDACAYVSALLRITGDLVEVTDRLVDACLAKGSDDNISVVLVTFPAAPAPSTEARKADRDLEDAIRKCITDMAQEGERLTKIVCQELQSIPNLLPGGGIHDKWTLIQKTMEEVGIITSDDEPMFDRN